MGGVQAVLARFPGLEEQAQIKKQRNDEGQDDTAEETHKRSLEEGKQEEQNEKNWKG